MRNKRQNFLDRKRQYEVKNLWAIPKSIIILSLGLAILALLAGAIKYAICLLVTAGLIFYGFLRESSAPAEVYRNGKIYKAKIIKRTPKSASAFGSPKTIFTVAFTNAKGKEVFLEFTQPSENFSPKYNKKRYFLPKEGDEISIYYYEKYPDICCPAILL